MKLSNSLAPTANRAFFLSLAQDALSVRWRREKRDKAEMMMKKHKGRGMGWSGGMSLKHVGQQPPLSSVNRQRGSG